MSVFESVTSTYTHVIGLDGREYTRLDNNHEVMPQIRVSYEWNVNKFQPDIIDPATYDQIGDDANDLPGTFDLAGTQRRLRAYLHELLEALSKVSAETTGENKSRLEKLERDILNLQKTIQEEKDQTVDKSNECYKILEAAKQFVREQEGALSSDQDELTR